MKKDKDLHLDLFFEDTKEKILESTDFDMTQKIVLINALKEKLKEIMEK